MMIASLQYIEAKEPVAKEIVRIEKGAVVLVQPELENRNLRVSE